jgi:hypothetical protein
MAQRVRVCVPDRKFARVHMKQPMQHEKTHNHAFISTQQGMNTESPLLFMNSHTIHILGLVAETAASHIGSRCCRLRSPMLQQQRADRFAMFVQNPMSSVLHLTIKPMISQPMFDTHTHTHTHTHTYMHTYIHTYIHACTHASSSLL